MTKRLVSTILVFSVAWMVTACGNSTTKDAASSPSGTGVPFTTQEISVLMFSDWYKSGIQAIEKDVNDNSDKLGFKLNIEKIAGGDVGGQILKARAAANELPMLLATYGTNWEKTNLGGLDHFQEIGGDWTKNYPDFMMKAPQFSDSGKVYAIPFDSINILGVFYNKKVFEKLKLQVPQTYQQFTDVLATIKAAGITPLYLPAKDTWTINAFEHEGMLRVNQPMTEVMDKVNTNQMKFIDFPLYKDTFVKHKELLDKGYIQKTFLSDTYDSAVKAIADGSAAMTINETWIMDSIGQKYPDQANDIGAFRVPFDEDKKASVFVPFSLSATDQFKDKDLLKKFIDYFTSPATVQKFFDAQGGMPYVKGVTSQLFPAQEDMKKVMDAGNGENFWGDLGLYDAGDQNASILDYFLGSISADDVLHQMDATMAKNARAKQDPNWK